jgi:hypothetical protein
MSSSRYCHIVSLCSLPHIHSCRTGQFVQLVFWRMKITADVAILPQLVYGEI